MSEPSAAWTPIEVSGPMNFSAPSTYERKRTPSSSMPRIAPERSLVFALRPLISSATVAVAHAEDLEAAGVGDHRLVPAHEVVDAAEPLDQLRAGGEEQVERVRQHHVVAEVGRLGDLERLDHRLRRERDEGGRADLPVVEPEDAGAGARGGVARADREAGRHSVAGGGGARAGRAPRTRPSARARRPRSGAGSARGRRRGASAGRARAAPRRRRSAPRSSRGRRTRRCRGRSGPRARAGRPGG